jgi:hypothetical protein
MDGQVARILTFITRLAVSTLLVPIALVAGMMTTPTSCKCGAVLPHAHTLFGIAGHYHGDGESQSGRDDSEIIASGQDGVNVQAPAGSPLQTLTALTAFSDTPLLLPGSAAPPTTTLIPDGQRAVPDVPPPRA